MKMRVSPRPVVANPSVASGAAIQFLNYIVNPWIAAPTACSDGIKNAVSLMMGI